MNGLHPFPAADPEIRENWRVTGEVLDELYFNPTFLAGQGAVAGGAAFTLDAPTGWSYVDFPAAGQPDWRVTERRRSRWQGASVRFTIGYTANGGSTNNFEFLIFVRDSRTGDLQPTAVTLAATLLLPGPAVANTQMEYAWVSGANAVTGARDWLSFTFIRNKLSAADTNANLLRVLGIRAEILPR